MVWSRAFQKFVCKHFYYITGFCHKKFNFFKFANFFADSKSRAQELSNDVSFVIFKNQILVFKYPSRDRANGVKEKCKRRKIPRQELNPRSAPTKEIVGLSG